MNIIEWDLRKAFFHGLFRREEVDDRIQLILCHIIECGGLGIPYRRESTGQGHTTLATS